MSVALVTGSGGLIGSEAVRFFAAQGFDVIGIDNDLRRHFFGESASTAWAVKELEATLGSKYRHYSLDVRDRDGIEKLLASLGRDLRLIVHSAAQPSHDWATRDPHIDFSVNAGGTLTLLEAARKFSPDCVFIFTSTNKVYGDTPNSLPFVEQETRWEIDRSHPWFEKGIDESMRLDRSHHSIFGASKLAADVMVQEYGLHFGMQTVSFRCGCVAGPWHSGAEMHGFLSYLVKCTAQGKPYTVYGHKAKQVRDCIHSLDVVTAFWQFMLTPKTAAVYNLGGGRQSNCSMLEAINLCEQTIGRKLDWIYSDQPRAGDHIWYISDTSAFERDYPGFRLTRTVPLIIKEIAEFVA